jgi:membrane fusion protein (multidrug efflux system)
MHTTTRGLLPRLFHLLGLTLALTAAVACGSSEQGHPHGSHLVSSPLRKTVTVTEEYVAQIQAIQHIELRAMERGYLEEIYVDEGQRVAAGQKMFKIMPRLAEAELKKAAAEAEFARIEYQNTKDLAERDVVSPNELALAKARLDKADAEKDLASAHLGLTVIKAPFEGIMNRLEVRKGSLVEDGEVLTALADNSTMWVYFNVSEAEYLDYQTQEHAEREPVRLVMANGKPFPHEGRIETIEADFNNETGNIAFRAAFPNPEGLLRHGETGKVRMTTTLENALVVPQKATFEVLDKLYVYVVDEHGELHTRRIRVAEALEHVFVVSVGLEENERILLDGLRKVREGDHIEVHYQKPETALANLDVHAE